MHLPTLNALLNATALLFLLLGRIAIARRQRRWHKNLMLIAFFFSTAFLVSYLIYHYSAVHMTTFGGQGWLRIFYYCVLFTHIPACRHRRARCPRGTLFCVAKTIHSPPPPRALAVACVGVCLVERRCHLPAAVCFFLMARSMIFT